MDLDLRDDLDRCFGDGPLVDDTDQLLDRGRTALRRRRLVEGVSVLAVAAAVVAGALVASGAGPDASSPDRPPVASRPAEAAASVSFTIVSDPSLPERLPAGQLPVELLASHQLRVGPGIELQRILIDPYDPAVYPASVALVYRRDGKTFWHLQYVHGDGSGSGATRRAPAGGDFDAWLAGQVRHPSTSMTSVVVDPTRPDDQPIDVDSRAGLHVARAVRIVRIVTNPYPWVAPASSAAALYVVNGEAYWFAGIMSDGGGSASSVPAGRGGRTFDEWVSDRADSIQRAALGYVSRQR